MSQSGYSSMFIMLNDQVSIEDLLKGIIIVSGNDSCVALAEGLMGSEENFVALIPFRKKTMPLGAKHLEGMYDYLIFYAKNKDELKYSLRSIEKYWRL